MARPTKAGLDYFELDCQLEEKVRLIQAEFGLKGFAIVVKLYQKIYGEFGYYCEWNEDSLLLFMSENGVSSCDEKNLISEIVSACIRRNIFSETLFHQFNILTSEGVQRRYLNATYRRERVELKKEYLLLSVDKNSKNVVINSIHDNRNEVNVCRNSQSRGKESREEESRGKESRGKNTSVRDRTYYPNDDELNRAFSDYVTMRKSIRKPMTDRAIELAMKNLEKLTAVPIEGHGYAMDHDLAVQILNQSIMNSWLGLFPLKDTTRYRAEEDRKDPLEDSYRMIHDWAKGGEDL